MKRYSLHPVIVGLIKWFRRLTIAAKSLIYFTAAVITIFIFWDQFLNKELHGSIYGKITDSKNAPISKVRVTLTGNCIQEDPIFVFSDDKGLFQLSFYFKDDCDFELELSHDEYKIEERDPPSLEEYIDNNSHDYTLKSKKNEN